MIMKYGRWVHVPHTLASLALSSSIDGRPTVDLSIIVSHIFSRTAIYISIYLIGCNFPEIKCKFYIYCTNNLFFSSGDQSVPNSTQMHTVTILPSCCNAMLKCQKFDCGDRSFGDSSIFAFRISRFYLGSF